MQSSLVGTAVAARYRVLECLGAGGMGEVYLAEDSVLDRRVALKRINAELASTERARERLHREARAAARLNHTGIAGVYDVVEHEGQPYIVMEYVAGVDLSTRVRGHGPLSPAETTRVGLELSSALAAAHALGVVHRDLKPANVSLRPDGHVKILDFGLSQLRAVEVDPQTATKLAPGGAGSQAYGSPGYSAPEQLLGKPVDPRADVFAAGATLYFLCTARGPFSGTDAMSLALASLTEAPPPAHEVAPAVPVLLSNLIARAMARNPDDRFQSAQALHDALRSAYDHLHAPPDTTRAAAGVAPIVPRHRVAWFAGAVLAVLAGVGFVFWPRAPDPGGAGDGSIRTQVVAVLQPENLTGDPSNDYLSVGFADSLFNDLAGFPDVTVVPFADVRDEVAVARNDRRALARSLGAAYLVDSSIQRAGGQLRVNARLVSSAGDVVWRSDFSGAVQDVFDLQRRMAQGVAEGLQLRVTPQAAARFGPRASSSVDALTEYWRGRTLLEGPARPDNIKEAVAAFQASVARDPALAEAHAGLGEAYWALYGQTGDADLVDQAVAASERALELDAEQPRVWLTLAVVHQGTGQPERALEDLDRAVALQPNGDDAYRLRGGVLGAIGRTDDALAAFDDAIARRPEYWRNHHQRGILLYRVGRLADARRAFESVIRLQPDNASGYQALGTVLQTGGDLVGARQNYEKALQVAPSRGAYSNLGTIHYWEGRYDQAVEAYLRAIDLAPRSALYRRNIGDAYRRLGKPDEARASYGMAVSLLEQALEVNPKDAAALTDLAVCEMKLGQLGRARQHIAEARALAPDDGDVLYGEAVVASMGGRPQEAFALLQQAVARGASIRLAGYDDDLEAVRRLPEYADWLKTTSQRP